MGVIYLGGEMQNPFVREDQDAPLDVIKNPSGSELFKQG
jgi:predicted membrane chloride channel (bestrophin family)